MSTTFKNARTYISYARRFGRRFMKERVGELKTSVAAAPHRPRPGAWSDDRLTVAWLGHATVLMNFYGTWLLTDPALRSRVGVRAGVVTLGPRRLVSPALTLKELPALDAVLVSHAHMDHCDLGTLRGLPRRTTAVVPRGMRDLVRRFERVHELAWGESIDVKGARVELLEVNHWGARRLTDKHRGYGGFLIQKNGRGIVFGGDTAYTNAFSRLPQRRLRIDLAILPIGGYNPYAQVHANPEEAWTMAREMGAEFLLPMHHSTFKLSREPAHEPINRLMKTVGEKRKRVALIEIGETWTLPE
jgi:L-ascorbate metabolism protein UlaG (beta-lactamase superfamily)